MKDSTIVLISANTEIEGQSSLSEELEGKESEVLILLYNHHVDV